MTNENELIRRGDALFALHNDVGLGTAHPAYECIASIPAVATSQPADTAIKADSRQRVTVKPLAWVEDLKGRWVGTAPRECGFGNFVFWIFTDNHKEFIRHKQGGERDFYQTLEAAKAAAQADYEARILSAIDLTPKPVAASAAADPVVKDTQAFDDMARVADEWMHKYEDAKRERDDAMALFHATEKRNLALVAELRSAIKNIEFGLADPVAVHINMLRGTIAKPSVEQIIHLYGVDALCRALQPVILAEVGVELPQTTLAEALAVPEVKALVEAAQEQLAYMDMCNDKGDLERNLRAALRQIGGAA